MADRVALVIHRRFGPRHSERERRRICGELGIHAGCWINDYDCGEADCVMGEHEGAPLAIVIDGVAITDNEGRNG